METSELEDIEEAIENGSQDINSTLEEISERLENLNETLKKLVDEIYKGRL